MNFDEEKILKRIYNVVPLGSLYMNELLQLMDIKLTTDKEITESACITCEIRPIMYLNKNFINEYCKTDEHLFMLVMHELYHKILGHTTLFNKTTLVDNIAFDAVINSILCKTFPSEAYVSFFKNINKSDGLPSALLRPPADDNPESIRNLMNELYNTNTGTYYEVYCALRENLEAALDSGQFILIGNHGTEDDDREISGSPFMKDFIERIVEKWPRPPKIISGRDDGGRTRDIDFEMKQISKEVKDNMRHLIHKAGLSEGKIDATKTSIIPKIVEVQTFIPRFKDRTALTKKEFIKNVILYNETLNTNFISNDSKKKAMIYFDVSGSVSDYIDMVAPVFKNPLERGECELYVFSTEVYKVSYDEFKRKKFKTTGGTNINSIFNHYNSLKVKGKSKKLIILTDGYVGPLRLDFQNQIKKENIKVYTGLFGESTYEYMKRFSKEIFDITRKRIKS